MENASSMKESNENVTTIIMDPSINNNNNLTNENVIEELLTTDRFFVYHSGDNEAMEAGSDQLKRVYEYFKEYGWETWEPWES